MSQSKIVTEPGEGTLEIFPLSTDTDFLQAHDYMTVFLPNPYMSVE